MLRIGKIIGAIVVVLGLATSASGQTSGAKAGFVTVAGTWVRAAPSHKSAPIGILRAGDRVTFRQCVPDCDAPKGWALLEPRGAVQLAHLGTGSRSPEMAWRSADATYDYGQSTGKKLVAYARPDLKSPVVGRSKASFRLAFVRDAALPDRWLRRPHGGFIPATGVKLFSPSRFVGVHDPAPWLAFVLRPTPLLDASGGKLRSLARYEVLPVIGLRGRRVQVEGGFVATTAVRIATRQRRPGQVPATARWVHIDLAQQALTAYEGDRHVFSTLTATGKGKTPTKTGIFPILGKTVHSSMYGPPPDEYFAEEVPHVMHFYRGQAIHGAYWHDGFGAPRSHGCVNLSPTDAAWLFGWAPPVVPQGWHTVLTRNISKTGLLVVIQRRGAVRPAAPSAVPADLKVVTDPTCLVDPAKVEAANLPAYCRFAVKGPRGPAPPTTNGGDR